MLSDINYRSMLKIKENLRAFIIFERLYSKNGSSIFIRKRLIHAGYQLLICEESGGEMIFSLIDNFDTKSRVYRHIIRNMNILK